MTMADIYAEEWVEGDGTAGVPGLTRLMRRINALEKDAPRLDID